MQMIVVHRNSDCIRKRESFLFRLARSSELIADIAADSLKENCRLEGREDIVISLPCELEGRAVKKHIKVKYYNGNLPVCLNSSKQEKMSRWFIVSNGRFVTRMDWGWLKKILDDLDADAVAVEVDPGLQGYRESVRFGPSGNIAGLRRVYNDSVVPVLPGVDWPCHVFIKSDVLQEIIFKGGLPLVFSDFIDRCITKSINFKSLKVGGGVLDLETEAGLLGFLTNVPGSKNHLSHRKSLYNHNKKSQIDGCTISAGARIFGKVVLGNNVRIDGDAVIAGPTILCDDVKIASGAAVRSSVITSGAWIPKGCLVQNRILELSSPRPHSKLLRFDDDLVWGQFNQTKSHFFDMRQKKNNFREWPRFSYAQYSKRMLDIIFSLIVLILFVPVFLVVAMVIKLSSRGPVFFKHKRQGLHGKEFFCLKFRTMITGADKIQEKLRCRNQVDGPQFKIESDPRITVVGRFLRDTYIDEIPQFINILVGQMSVIGPRPSPRGENCFCPYWRDARLSVRPGIAGLWQICRTRRAGHDFQEWIYYDTKYVRELSLQLDLWIFWKTARKLITNFIDQF